VAIFFRGNGLSFAATLFLFAVFFAAGFAAAVFRLTFDFCLPAVLFLRPAFFLAMQQVYQTFCESSAPRGFVARRARIR
jgi:hypothetical protein